MIDTASTTPEAQAPPLWPSVGALLIAGWAGGLVGNVLWMPLLGARGVGDVFGPSGGVSAAWLAPTLAAALVASVVLPRILRAFCNFELGLGSALVVTIGGSLAGFAVTTFVYTLLFFRGGVAVPASTTFFVLPQIVALTVSYQLLKRLAHPASGRRGPGFTQPISPDS